MCAEEPSAHEPKLTLFFLAYSMNDLRSLTSAGSDLCTTTGSTPEEVPETMVRSLSGSKPSVLNITRFWMSVLETECRKV